MSLTGREHFYPEFRCAVEQLCSSGPVFDLGTDFKFRKELKPFKSLLSEHGYYALGYHSEFSSEQELPDVDGDIQALPFRLNSVSAVICLEVFEHLPAPWKAAEELYRVLKPGGRSLVTVPFMTGYHGKRGVYGDYFRYTRDGLKTLFDKFDEIRIHPLGGKL